MSTSRSPVGPLPAKVYLRRRIVVGLGVLAVLVAIVLIVVRPGQGAATPPADPPAASASAESAESESEAEEQPDEVAGSPAPCTAASVQLEAVMDKEHDYAQDEQPLLSVSITNISTSSCLLQAGTDVQEYRITSGSDLIWSSKHCQQDSQPTEQVLEPGGKVATTPFTWNRERSDPNACDGEWAAAVGGGATYMLQVFVGDLESDTNRFVLL